MKTFREFITEGSQKLELNRIGVMKHFKLSVVETDKGAEKDFKGGKIGFDYHGGKEYLQLIDGNSKVVYEMEVDSKSKEDSSIKDVRKTNDGYELTTFGGDVWKLKGSN